MLHYDSGNWRWGEGGGPGGGSALGHWVRKRKTNIAHNRHAEKCYNLNFKIFSDQTDQKQEMDVHSKIIGTAGLKEFRLQVNKI